MELLHKELTEKVIGCFYEVYNTLGYGFLESVYEKAFMHELELRGLEAIRQGRVDVFYKEQKVGDYLCDILVEDKILLELKATPLKVEHEYQLLNYLKATDVEVGYLFSFGKEAKFKRRVFENEFK